MEILAFLIFPKFVLTFTLQFTEYANDYKSWSVLLVLVGFNALVSL